jgi:type II secretory pathway pseudopilin PulG
MYFLKKEINNSDGFTLVEMLVASAVFIVIVTTVTAIFVLGINLQRRATRGVTLQQEAQMVMSSMSKKIRKSLIDYDYSGYEGNLTEPEDELALRDPKIIYRLNNKILEQSTDEINWAAVTSAKVEVKRLNFYIYPLEDPFDPLNPQNIQPRVTIVMKLASDDQEIILQETIPQRFSERK